MKLAVQTVSDRVYEAVSALILSGELAADAPVRQVHFTHEAPAYRAEFDRTFQAPVVFASHWNAMLIDIEFLSLK